MWEGIVYMVKEPQVEARLGTATAGHTHGSHDEEDASTVREASSLRRLAVSPEAQQPHGNSNEH